MIFSFFRSSPRVLYRPKELGFTLVELLVGLFLSIFIGAMALTFMVSSAKSFRVQTNDAVSNENARFVLEQMSQYIRLAGWRQASVTKTQAQTLDVVSNIRVCPDNESAILQGNTERCNVDGLAGRSDRLAIDFIVREPTLLCNGEMANVAASGRLELAYIFWTADLEQPNDNVRSLYCQPYNVSASQPIGAAVPLVDGVDRFEVQYGVDSNNDEVIDRYQSYSNLIAGGSARLTQNVRAIRFAVLLNGGFLPNDANNNTEANQTRRYQLLDAPQVQFTDTVFRQVYSSTVMLPNALRAVEDPRQGR